jgi:hypothetical protein
VEDSSFRTISNPGDKAIRVDYYRMMRKWRTDLYRYGLRLTYDFVIPTPGVRLWARWRQIAALEQKMRSPAEFDLKPKDISEDATSLNYWQTGCQISCADETPLRLPPLNFQHGKSLALAMAVRRSSNLLLRRL